MDLSLAKDTYIAERVSLQFRAEFFNILNQHAFAIPNRTLGTNGFGFASFNWQNVTPFGIRSASQFFLGPPPALTSDRYTRAYDEVKVFGDVNSTERSQHQTNVALFPCFVAGRLMRSSAKVGDTSVMLALFGRFEFLSLDMESSGPGMFYCTSRQDQFYAGDRIGQDRRIEEGVASWSMLDLRPKLVVEVCMLFSSTVKPTLNTPAPRNRFEMRFTANHVSRSCGR